MKEKCQFCNYKNIDHIIFYDIRVDKCAKCDFIRVSIDNFDKIIMNSILINNFMNSSKYHSFYDMPIKNLKTIKKFLLSLNLSNFVFEDRNDIKLCNFCHDETVVIRNRFCINFTMYYCKSCNSLYFLKSDFENAILYLQKYAIQKSKWYKFIYYILEIFQ
jgi:Zn-finger nucleic acid-binding protein